MPRYLVSVPMAGYLVLEVEAPSEEGAFEEAMNKATIDDLEDWEAFDMLCEGNLLHAGAYNEPHIECLDE